MSLSKGRPKGAKDTYKRYRNVDKALVPKESRRAFKKYISLEGKYNALKKERAKLSVDDTNRVYYTLKMRSIRREQHSLHEIIIKGRLGVSLSKRLGISVSSYNLRHHRLRKKEDND